jgi:hypothetical protein
LVLRVFPLRFDSLGEVLDGVDSAEDAVDEVAEWGEEYAFWRLPSARK